MKQRRYFLDFEKETAWLNQMAAAGHVLQDKAGAVYTFSQDDTKDAVVHIDYQPTMGRCEYTNYLATFYDVGWQIVHGKHSAGPKYFVAIAPTCDHAMFQNQGKAQRYARAISERITILLPLAVVAIILWAQGTLWSASESWYQTPGLWDKQGAEFLGSFIFETVFVIARVGVPSVSVGVCLYMLVSLVYQSLLYRQAVADFRKFHTAGV